MENSNAITTKTTTTEMTKKAEDEVVERETGMETEADEGLGAIGGTPGVVVATTTDAAPMEETSSDGVGRVAGAKSIQPEYRLVRLPEVVVRDAGLGIEMDPQTTMRAAEKRKVEVKDRSGRKPTSEETWEGRGTKKEWGHLMTKTQKSNAGKRVAGKRRRGGRKSKKTVSWSENVVGGESATSSAKPDNEEVEEDEGVGMTPSSTPTSRTPPTSIPASHRRREDPKRQRGASPRLDLPKAMGGGGGHRGGGKSKSPAKKRPDATISDVSRGPARAELGVAGPSGLQRNVRPASALNARGARPKEVKSGEEEGRRRAREEQRERVRRRMGGPIGPRREPEMRPVDRLVHQKRLVEVLEAERSRKLREKRREGMKMLNARIDEARVAAAVTEAVVRKDPDGSRAEARRLRFEKVKAEDLVQTARLAQRSLRFSVAGDGPRVVVGGVAASGSAHLGAEGTHPTVKMEQTDEEMREQKGLANAAEGGVGADSMTMPPLEPIPMDHVGSTIRSSDIILPDAVPDSTWLRRGVALIELGDTTSEDESVASETIGASGPQGCQDNARRRIPFTRITPPSPPDNKPKTESDDDDTTWEDPWAIEKSDAFAHQDYRYLKGHKKNMPRKQKRH